MKSRNYYAQNNRRGLTLGEFRTLSREFDNKLKIRLSCYDEVKGVTTHDLEFDMSNDNELYFRIVDGDSE